MLVFGSVILCWLCHCLVAIALLVCLVKALNCTRRRRPFVHALFAFFRDPVNRHLATHTETRIETELQIGESIFVTLLGSGYTLSWSFTWSTLCPIVKVENRCIHKLCLWIYIYISNIYNTRFTYYIISYHIYILYICVLIYIHIIVGTGWVALAETAPFSGQQLGPAWDLWGGNSLEEKQKLLGFGGEEFFGWFFFTYESFQFRGCFLNFRNLSRICRCFFWFCWCSPKKHW